MIGPGDAIELASDVGSVDPEAELTVVGSKVRWLTLKNARGAILDFTIDNDVSAGDLQISDELWIRAKSQDTFTPVGPRIVTGLDDSDLAISIVHNGTELQAASSADLGWKVDEILVYLTSFMTLHPGDTVTCRVQGIGELTNPVKAASWEQATA